MLESLYFVNDLVVRVYFTGRGSQVAGHRFMSYVNTRYVELIVTTGYQFRVYLVLDRRLCRHVAIVAPVRGFGWLLSSSFLGGN
jgi:hypothetical protein